MRNWKHRKKAYSLPRTEALDDRDVLLTRQESAEYLRKSVPTLERWARIGFGPKPISVGRRALYRLTDLRAFTGTGTSEAA